MCGGPGDPNGGGGGNVGWHGEPPWGRCAERRAQTAASMAEGMGTHGVGGFSLGGGMVPDLK
jgi:hypothetical protein